MAKLFQLFGEIFIDNDEANKSIDKTTEKAEGAGSKIGSAFKSIAKGAAAIGTAAVGTASALGAGAYAMVNSTATQADTIDKLSERTSINREELQRWMHACDQSGVRSDVLETAVKKMSSTLDDAANGSATARDSLNRLGLTLEDLEGLSTEEKFDKITNALADMEDGTERNALGADLLGKGYTEMLPLLNAGSEGINALKKEADDLGIVMSEDSVKAGVKFGDTVANIKAAAGGFMNMLGNAVMPVAQSFANLIIDSLPKAQSFFARLAPVIQRVFENLLPPLFSLAEVLFPLLMSFIETSLPILESLIVSILPIIISFLEMIAPYLAEIANSILPLILNLISALLPILEVLLPLLQPLLDITVAIIAPLAELLNLILIPIINVVTKIIEFILPVLHSGLSLLAEMLSTKFKIAFEAVGNIFTNIKNIFQNIIDFVKNVFTGNWKSAWQNVVDIFKNIWKSMENIVKTPINFIITAINTMINGINKLSFEVPDWVPGIGGETFGFDIPNVPKLRRGLEYVPHDDYPALLHKGEQVLTASERKERIQEQKEKQKEPKNEPSIVVKVDVHIERFENNSPSDIEELVEEIMYIIEEKIRGKKKVFE